MPEIVVNTGPIIALVAGLGHLSILDRLYDRIILPREVVTELTAGGQGCPELSALDKLDRLQRQTDPVPLPTLLSAELDSGEASVIQTALVVGVPLTAIDEKAGRRLARLHGLNVTGSIGILCRAYREHLIDDLATCFDRMRDQGIWVSEALIQKALETRR